jgi:hypothetical protein
VLTTVINTIYAMDMVRRHTAGPNDCLSILQNAYGLLGLKTLRLRGAQARNGATGVRRVRRSGLRLTTHGITTQNLLGSLEPRQIRVKKPTSSVKHVAELRRHTVGDAVDRGEGEQGGVVDVGPELLWETKLSIMAQRIATGILDTNAHVTVGDNLVYPSRGAHPPLTGLSWLSVPVGGDGLSRFGLGPQATAIMFAELDPVAFPF